MIELLCQPRHPNQRAVGILNSPSHTEQALTRMSCPDPPFCSLMRQLTPCCVGPACSRFKVYRDTPQTNWFSLQHSMLAL
jgi:hypothetical protein